MESIKWVGSDFKNLTNAFVGMFDILGFCNIVENTNPEDLLDKYRFLLQQKRDAANIPEISSRGVKIWKVATTIFSDTILVWTEEDVSKLDIFLVTCSVLIKNSVDLGWPVRGGIAYGKCYMNRKNRIFVGPPIVNAFKTEQSQEWIGAAFHDSCLNNKDFFRISGAHDCIMEYDVPVKKDKRPLKFAVNWTDRLYEPLKTVNDLKIKQPVQYRNKYENTEIFIKWINNNR